MQQSYDSELKRWDIRLLIISLTLTFIFLGLTIYLSKKSDDSYHQAKIALYENQLLLGNIEYDVDRLLKGDKEVGSSLKRLMVKANTYAQIGDDNSANWGVLVREVTVLNNLLSQNGENGFGDQGGAEQLAKAHSSAKNTIKKLSDKIGSSIEQISPSTVKSIPTLLGDLPKIALTISMVLALLCVAGFLFLIFKIINERTKESQSTLIHNQKNQEAILELLDVMTALSEGDLTVHARVSDDITGTLADSFNYSVEELHGLVSTVNQSSDKVMEAVKEAASVTEVLAKASSTQASQIVEATDTVNRVTQAMLDVSSQTSAAVDIAMSSTEVARSGSERVRSTIVGMDQIREHIQETSKRIKRLGESSQEIGDIVELIDDIADQTHILALNASIQASAAGDAGRGFAVVADEVQRLAERTGNATRRVESLVKTIQTDTNEAIFAMEKSTSEVVNGANLAERAGESLNEIESVSGRLATLIQNVSKSSREVSNLGGKMKSSMDSIKDLTEQNVNSTKITTISVEKIHELANELRESVTGFKIK